VSDQFLGNVECFDSAIHAALLVPGGRMMHGPMMAAAVCVEAVVVIRVSSRSR
jgi:hypothetical protein